MRIRASLLYALAFVIVLFIISRTTLVSKQQCICKNNLFKTKDLVVTQVPPVAKHYKRGKPVDRYYIEKFLNDNKQYIKGSVLEVKDNDYTLQFGKNITNSDILDLSKSNKIATMVHDLQDTNWFPSDKFDCFICTQTLQYLYDIKAGFKSAKKMLKKGGVFLVTVPCVTQLSYEPGQYYEYWHFTDQTLYNLAKEAGFREIKVYEYGNALAATALLQGIAVEDFKDANLLDVQAEVYPVTVTLVAIK